MIPQQLTLKNFLSYREATLDFRGLHVACICGANGAGKSSLLEAIAWSIWGQSRAHTEDDIIHQGSLEALVDFTFQCHEQTYRIIRSRYRGQATTLEFQVLSPTGWRSLTQKGVRTTQQIISRHLRLDYDTFINSAYLRQGRADEFMLKRPSDRKQILADLLKLNQYDEVAEQAKEKARQFKAELTVLERSFEAVAQQLRQGDGLAIESANLIMAIAQMRQQQVDEGDRLRQLQQVQQQRQDWRQQLTVHQQQQRHLQQDCQRLQQDLGALQQQQRQLEQILAEGEAIATHYTQFQSLQAEEETLTAKFQTYQSTQNQRQQLVQQQTEQIALIKDQIRHLQTQQENLVQQQQDNQQILSKAEEIKAALEQLKQARHRLTEMDQLQMKALPLIQRRQQLQTQLDRAQARLLARLEELQSLRQQLEAQQQQQPQLQQTVADVIQQIEHLEKRRDYQQKVREKGVERRNFLERLQERQREFERELAELDQKLALLRREIPQREPLPEAQEIAIASPAEETSRGGSPYALYQPRAEVSLEHLPLFSADSYSPPVLSQPYPPCPLCDRPLDEQHWQHVLHHHQQEQQDIRNQLWVIREQLTTSDREIRVLRQEYRDVDKELAHYGTALERRGQLQEQLQRSEEGLDRLQQILSEQLEIERSLQQNDYAVDLAEELHLIDQSLEHLNYDDKNHALARGQVDRFRWAEIKQAEIKQAQRRQAQVEKKLPEILNSIAPLEAELESIAHAPLQQQIDELDRHLAAIGYSVENHTALRHTLRQAQPAQLRYQELLQAQRYYPNVQERSQDLAAITGDRQQALQEVTTQVEVLQQHLQNNPDSSTAIQTLEAQTHQNRTQLDQNLAQLGRLQQQQQHLETVKTQHATLSQQLHALRHQLRVHQELSQAFGKNGLQALMIENVLPQLEAEANQILGRLSANQLHIQFVTQRSNRKSKIQNPKLVETLDILISDIHGTRPYETYSGGEAFRVNFAIRLALARLLAQRSGTALQLLIVDEGFGTQDEAGCDRLISSINAIAPDFSCILTVTHMPHLKEAFQTRIEVYKTENGSQVRIME